MKMKTPQLLAAALVGAAVGQPINQRRKTNMKTKRMSTKHYINNMALVTMMAVSLVLPGKLQAAEPLTQQEANEIAADGYIYFYPLMSMDVTRKVLTNVPAGKKPGLGPMGMFHHMRAFPDAKFREVVRPNFDTLYSSAWFDVTREPVIVSVPDTESRYYVLPIYDMWSDIFAAPGKRTSGTRAANFAIVMPGWKGSLPQGVERIETPTPTCWIIVRTQTNGPKDYEAVHKVQDGYRLTPLSQWGKEAKPVEAKVDPSVNMSAPLDQVNSMDGVKFFTYAAELMKTQPPHLTDWSILARLKRLGIEPGKSIDIGKADPVVKAALEAAPKAGMKRMKDKLPTLARVVNGWQMNTDTMGVYGDYYLKRAVVALVGLGANHAEDAVYPLNIVADDGKPMVGENKYLLHFNKEELPPAAAFWSITMYDAEGFQTANPINRFAIGDRDSLKYNADGSLDIYIQHESPGADKESNWLPAPTGRLGVTMRLYAPKVEVLEGRWNPPAVKITTPLDDGAKAQNTSASVLADGAGAKSGRFDNMHKTRFIEIFLAHRDAKTGKLAAECYNSMFTTKGIPASKDTAPQALVEGLDFAKMKTDFGVLGASLNGPKIWLPDWTEIDMGVERDFNGVKATWVAQLNMGDNAGGVAESTPYKPMSIARKSGLGWNKGATVLLLDDAEGNTWIMKGFQLGLKPQHTYEQFVAAGAGNFKKLPPGWKFRIKTLEKDYIEVPVTGVATIMPDEFFNVYDKTGPGMSNYKP
jgi:hypothetical protein